MAVSSETKKRWALATALRGALLLLAGLYAVILPVDTLAVLVLLGGALFLVDGLIGLWSLTFGGAKSGNYWFDVIRNVLSVISGVLILIFPLMSTYIWVWFVVYLIAIQAIIVGVMEITLVVREREQYAKIWPVILNGVLYVLFGIALVLSPMIAATIMVILGGVLAILFAVGLFALAWRMYQAAKGAGAPAA